MPYAPIVLQYDAFKFLIVLCANLSLSKYLKEKFAILYCNFLMEVIHPLFLRIKPHTIRHHWEVCPQTLISQKHMKNDGSVMPSLQIFMSWICFSYWTEKQVSQINLLSGEMWEVNLSYFCNFLTWCQIKFINVTLHAIW